jgi:hypothetical protein
MNSATKNNFSVENNKKYIDNNQYPNYSNNNLKVKHKWTKHMFSKI